MKDNASRLHREDVDAVRAMFRAMVEITADGGAIPEAVEAVGKQLDAIDAIPVHSDDDDCKFVTMMLPAGMVKFILYGFLTALADEAMRLDAMKRSHEHN